MKLTEAQMRKIIREELLKEMNFMNFFKKNPSEGQGQEGKLDFGAIAGGASVGMALGLVNWLMWYVQTSGAGAQLAEKIRELSQLVQGAMEE